MKKVKYLKSRVGDYGGIAAGTTAILHDGEAVRLERSGDAEILESLPNPPAVAPEPPKAEAATDQRRAEHGRKRPEPPKAESPKTDDAKE